ncbi:MAG: hypothetical protein NVS3B12_15670 [Acidimicrobiales bacterium]
MGSAVALVLWAAVAAGPVGIFPVVGLVGHRRGLVVLAGAIGVLPVMTGHVTDPVVILPCLLAAVVLLRSGLVRWPGLAGPSRTADTSGLHTPAEPEVAPASLPPAAGVLVRRAGRVAGRSGSVLARHADIVVPQGARAAGKIVGRLRPAPKR